MSKGFFFTVVCLATVVLVAMANTATHYHAEQAEVNKAHCLSIGGNRAQYQKVCHKLLFAEEAFSGE